MNNMRRLLNLFESDDLTDDDVDALNYKVGLATFKGRKFPEEPKKNTFYLYFTYGENDITTKFIRHGYEPDSYWESRVVQHHEDFPDEYELIFEWTVNDLIQNINRWSFDAKHASFDVLINAFIDYINNLGHVYFDKENMEFIIDLSELRYNL